MYYLAITFIFIGLGCLLYLFVIRSFQSGKQEVQPPEDGPPLPEPVRQHRKEELRDHGFGESPPQMNPDLYRDSLYSGHQDPPHYASQGAAVHPGQSAQYEYGSPGASHSSPGHPGPGGRLQGSTGSAGTGRAPTRFHGILFLDESGQAVSAAENWQRVSPDLFSKLKRMGPCELQYSDRSFLIHSDAIRLQYRVDDLTRILFLDSGFAFIPERGGPSPLILTREVNRFKDFLRDHSL